MRRLKPPWLLLSRLEFGVGLIVVLDLFLSMC